MTESDNSKKINRYGGRGHSKRRLLNEGIEQLIELIEAMPCSVDKLVPKKKFEDTFRLSTAVKNAIRKNKGAR